LPSIIASDRRASHNMAYQTLGVNTDRPKGSGNDTAGCTMETMQPAARFRSLGRGPLKAETRVRIP
jgi:hypothetical protein